MKYLICIFLAVLCFSSLATSAQLKRMQARILTISTSNGTILKSTLSPSGHHVTPIFVNVTTVNDESFTLDLRLNGRLFSKGYREKVCTENGDYYLDFNEATSNCHYIGKVKGYINSIASLSTCGEIMGYFTVEEKSYTIAEYSKGATTYAVVAEDTQTNWTCGVASVVNSLRSSYSRFKRDNNEKIDRTTRFIELYPVSDQSHSQLFTSDMAVTLRIQIIVNLASILYQAVDMYLVLVGMEIWRTSKIVVNTNNAEQTLYNFYNYKNNTLNGNSPSHDNACLFLGVSFPEDVVGLARRESMCHSVYSGNFISDRIDLGYSFGTSATLLTHEIGHNLGLKHDTDAAPPCSCSDFTGSCIMWPGVSTIFSATKFSSCSQRDLVSERRIGLDLCLFNIPDLSSISSILCGNGLIDDGEECDCGGLPYTICNLNCCDRYTCKLKNAVCAMGKCCNVDTCQLYAANTICRSSEGPCDINELCDGKSPFCPVNLYKHDGTPCVADSDQAFCYEGKCQNYNSQCHYVWGPTAYPSPDVCFSSLNVRGNVGGSCKIVLGPQNTYTPCNISNVKCGQLFCEKLGSPPFDPPIVRADWVMEVNWASPKCKSGSFDFGTQILTPGFVPNGAACDINKMCVNQKCVDVDSITSINPCPSQCFGGVCNNKGKCQCENGAQYPNCSQTLPTIPFSSFTSTTSTTGPRPRTSTNDANNIKTLYSGVCLQAFLEMLCLFILKIFHFI